MTAREHEQFADDVGAYLLGALDPGEEKAFERHLRTCDDCRQHVVRLEVARDALPRAVDQTAAPESLKASLMSTVRAEAAEAAEPAPARRRSRWRERFLMKPQFAAAAAAVLLALGIGIGAVVGAAGGGDEPTETVAAEVDRNRMPRGEASLVVQEDGRAILRLEGMQQPPADQVYEVWVRRGNEVTPSSLFTVASDGSGAAAIPEDLSDADEVMVTREPRSGSRLPSEQPVITVPLAS